MHVGTGRTPGRPHLGDGLPLGDLVARLDQDLAVVAVTRGVAVAVVDLDQIAVAVVGPGFSHDSGRHCKHV